MSLMDIYERQQQETERFKAMRDKAWEQVLSDNEKLAEAFGGKDRLSEDARKTYDSRINSFNAEWSMEGGSRYNDLQDQHDKQIRAATGRSANTVSHSPRQSSQTIDAPENTLKEKFKNQSERITDKEQEPQVSNDNDEAERQQLREKIAKQQAAIKARKMQKKRSR